MRLSCYRDKMLHATWWERSLLPAPRSKKYLLHFNLLIFQFIFNYIQFIAYHDRPSNGCWLQHFDVNVTQSPYLFYDLCYPSRQSSNKHVSNFTTFGSICLHISLILTVLAPSTLFWFCFSYLFIYLLILFINSDKLKRKRGREVEWRMDQVDCYEL